MSKREAGGWARLIAGKWIGFARPEYRGLARHVVVLELAGRKLLLEDAGDCVWFHRLIETDGRAVVPEGME